MKHIKVTCPNCKKNIYCRRESEFVTCSECHCVMTIIKDVPLRPGTYEHKFKNFCQSCAMPLEEKIYGTNEDGTKNEEYCIYCYKNGKFTSDMSMEEMKNFCIQKMVEFVPNMTKEKATEMMNETFPKLKRWKKN